MLSLTWLVLFFSIRLLVVAQDPRRPYPIPDAALAAATTSILDQSSYLKDFADQQWYLDNIPFVDFPDPLLQDLYYYRQSVVKRHLKFERQGIGEHIPDHNCKTSTQSEQVGSSLNSSILLTGVRRPSQSEQTTRLMPCSEQVPNYS